MKSTYQAVEVSAPDLAKLAIEAHGGLDRWERFTTLSVHGINAGVLWGAKGKAGVLDDVTIIVDLRDEKVSHWPFGSPDRRSRFEPQRVALENANGEVLEESRSPPVIVPGTHSRDPVDRFAARILRWMRDVDLSEYSVSPCQTRH